jgi:hypothetical protein
MIIKVNGHVDLKIITEPFNEIHAQCWDKDLLSDDNMGEVLVDQDGNFEFLISLVESGESHPEIFIKLVSKGDVIFTSKIFNTDEYFIRNKATGFVEKTTIDLGTINA